MTADFSIRLARAEDATELPAIELAASELFRTVAGLEGHAGNGAIPEDRQRTMIRKGHSLVAESGGRLVGFVTTQPHGRELHVHELSVQPVAQRRGIGAVLLGALRIDARNSGYAAITLTTFSDVPWNAPFYARCGFAVLEDLTCHRRLARELEQDASQGLPRDRRCAMFCPLD